MARRPDSEYEGKKTGGGEKYFYYGTPAVYERIKSLM